MLSPSVYPNHHSTLFNLFSSFPEFLKSSFAISHSPIKYIILLTKNTSFSFKQYLFSSSILPHLNKALSLLLIFFRSPDISSQIPSQSAIYFLIFLLYFICYFAFLYLSLYLFPFPSVPLLNFFPLARFFSNCFYVRIILTKA